MDLNTLSLFAALTEAQVKDVERLKYTLGALATIGLYSVLYRETKIYRFFEHLFLGLAAGFSLHAIWGEVLKIQWWDPMVGQTARGSEQPIPGYWMYILIVPVALLGYSVFSKKYNWLSRVPIGILLGFWAGQQVQVFWKNWGPQVYNSIRPIYPTTWERFTVPSNLTPEQQGIIYPVQALNNLVFVVTILCVLSYFFFSVDVKNRVLRGANTAGRWLLMIGFGAIFGTTIMTRFSLVIDRMFYIWVEWLGMLLQKG